MWVELLLLWVKSTKKSYSEAPIRFCQYDRHFFADGGPICEMMQFKLPRLLKVSNENGNSNLLLYYLIRKCKINRITTFRLGVWSRRLFISAWRSLMSNKSETHSWKQGVFLFVQGGDLEVLWFFVLSLAPLICHNDLLPILSSD